MLPEAFQVGAQLQSWDMSFKDKSDSDYVSGQVWQVAGTNCTNAVEL